MIHIEKASNMMNMMYVLCIFVIMFRVFLQCPQWMWDITGIAATFAVLALQRTAGELSTFHGHVQVDSTEIPYDFPVSGTSNIYDLKRTSQIAILDALAGSTWHVNLHVLALSPAYLR